MGRKQKNASVRYRGGPSKATTNDYRSELCPRARPIRNFMQSLGTLFGRCKHRYSPLPRVAALDGKQSQMAYQLLGTSYVIIIIVANSRLSAIEWIRARSGESA